MKQVLFVCGLVFSLAGFSQTQINVDEIPRAVSKGTQPSFFVEIPQTTLKEAEKNWLKYASRGSKGKAVVVNGDNLQNGVVNKNIAVNPFDIYSKLRATIEGVGLTVWLSENNTIISANEPNTGVNSAMQKFVRDFAVQEYRRVVLNELKAELSKQKSLEKELARLIKEEDKSVKKVSENERSTERAYDAIATNNSDIQNSSYKINDQKGMVEQTAADANATKGAKKTLGELENEKKDLQKKNETQGRHMDKRNKENRKEGRSMVASKENQLLKTTAIENQKQKVREVQTKLDNIK